MDDRVTRIASRIENLEVGPLFTREVGQLSARHVGHNDVGEQDSDWVAAVQKAKRVSRAGCFKNAIPKLTQRFDGNGTDAVVILNDQHDLATRATMHDRF